MNEPVKFHGRSVSYELGRAMDALTPEHEVVILEAGQNMPIKAILLDGEYDGGLFEWYAWNEKEWVKTGETT